MPEFNSRRWDVNLLVNDRRALPADRLFALVMLWNGRANDLDRELRDSKETPERLVTDGVIAGYRRASQELIAALDAVYPGWRVEGDVKLIPQPDPDTDPPVAA